MANPTSDQLQAWLDEARTARHQLVTGSAIASVQTEGQGQVTYSKAHLDKLDAYISSLMSQLSASTSSAAARVRPIQFTF